MRFSNTFGFRLVALLALGFLGQVPLGGESSNLRHISSCSDPNATSTPKVSVPGVTVDFFRFLQDDSSRRSDEAYSLFLRSMQLNSALISLAGQPFFGSPVPLFPSYALPSINDYAVDLARPDSSHQVFGGLMKNPQVQFLIHPFSVTNQGSEKNSLAAAVGFPVIQASGTLNLSLGNRPVTSKF